jgi:hypothetical protein
VDLRYKGDVNLEMEKYTEVFIPKEVDAVGLEKHCMNENVRILNGGEGD